MLFYDIVEKVAGETGESLRTVSGKLGHRPNYLSDIKAKGRITSVDNAARILDVCGYGLYAMPITNAPLDAIRITADGQQPGRNSQDAH
jgi:hypothetical protein